MCGALLLRTREHVNLIALRPAYNDNHESNISVIAYRTRVIYTHCEWNGGAFTESEEYGLPLPH